jgi:hypothetical protein
MPQLLLHAITDATAPRPTPAMQGPRGQRLCAPAAGDIACWATIWMDTDARLGRSDLFEHHTVVQAVWASGACLPARFPTWLPDEGALNDALNRRRGALRDALERVRGRAELAITVLSQRPADDGRPTASSVPGGPSSMGVRRSPGEAGSDPGVGAGRRFLEERRRALLLEEAAQRTTRELARSIEEAAGPALGGARHEYGTGADVLLSSALLVVAAQADVVRDRIVRLAAGWSDARALINGPWPPYSFAGPDRAGFTVGS